MAIFGMSVLPSFEVQKRFTWPVQTVDTVAWPALAKEHRSSGEPRFGADHAYLAGGGP